MLLSKSFGYAVRGILYIALSGDETKRIQVAEIADDLGVPRHFLAKILKVMAREGVLDSTKGPYGGFSMNKKTRSTKLVKLVEYVEGMEQFNECVLSFRRCNRANPCPLHDQMLAVRDQLIRELSTTTIGDLMDERNPNFIRSISTL